MSRSNTPILRKTAKRNIVRHPAKVFNILGCRDNTINEREVTSHKDAKIQYYSLDYYSVIENLQEHGNSATAKNLVLFGERVREWYNNKEEITIKSTSRGRVKRK